MVAAKHIYFLAHAGREAERAMQLRDFLHPAVPTFLDVCDLAPGQRWSVELLEHQRESRATVALVASNADDAYFLDDEIMGAIAAERDDPSTHTLIPVYLDGMPSDPFDIPYGLRARHALDARKLGLEGVADQLRSLAASMRGSSSSGRAPKSARPALDRHEIFDRLCGLLHSQFDELVFRLSAPKHQLMPPTQALSLRAIDLIQWAEQAGPHGLLDLDAVLRRIAPRQPV